MCYHSVSLMSYNNDKLVSIKLVLGEYELITNHLVLYIIMGAIHLGQLYCKPMRNAQINC